VKKTNMKAARVAGLALALLATVSAVGQALSPEAGSPISAEARKLQIIVPAYDTPTGAFLAALADPAQTPEPPYGVVLNTADNGHSGWSALDRISHKLRKRGIKTFGYVPTAFAARSYAGVAANIDGWLAPRSVNRQPAAVQYDGIFIDEMTRDCGPVSGSLAWQVYYNDLYKKIHQTENMQVIGNPGTAIADCYIPAGSRGADIFVTFEGTAADYQAAGWVGGNVWSDAGYRLGVEYTDVWFQHLVHAAPVAAGKNAFQTAFGERKASFAYVTDQALPNPWAVKASYLADQLQWRIGTDYTDKQ
jgi:hypothetical protein